MTENRVWRLRSRPVKNIDEKCLELCKEAIPTIGDGQLLCKNLYFSIDPTHRIWMSDIPQYMPKVELGEVMRAATVAEVVESKNPQFSVGTTVVAFGGMCDYFVGFRVVMSSIPLGSMENYQLRLTCLRAALSLG